MMMVNSNAPGFNGIEEQTKIDSDQLHCKTRLKTILTSFYSVIDFNFKCNLSHISMEYIIGDESIYLSDDAL